MNFAKIVGTGSYLPDTVLSNEDLEKKVETSSEWIIQRTGIRQRHVVRDDENVVTLGVMAAKRALAAANLKPQDIDYIVVATCTSHLVFPATACLIQAELGVPPCAAFDVQAACSGFIYALSMANAAIQTGQAQRALVIGAETMSKVVDWNDRATCVLFGDGAGAFILEKSDTPGIISTHLCSDGTQKDLLYLNNAKMSEDHYLMMQGRPLFKWAVKWLAEVASQALSENNITADEISWVVPHQANIRIINATVKTLGIPEEKVVVTVDKHANTSGASIPLAFDAAISEGKIKRGQKILLEAFGGGLTWASALIEY